MMFLPRNWEKLRLKSRILRYRVYVISDIDNHYGDGNLDIFVAKKRLANKMAKKFRRLGFNAEVYDAEEFGFSAPVLLPHERRHVDLNRYGFCGTHGVTPYFRGRDFSGDTAYFCRKCEQQVETLLNGLPEKEVLKYVRASEKIAAKAA